MKENYYYYYCIVKCIDIKNRRKSRYRARNGNKSIVYISNVIFFAELVFLSARRTNIIERLLNKLTIAKIIINKLNDYRKKNLWIRKTFTFPTRISNNLEKILEQGLHIRKLHSKKMASCRGISQNLTQNRQFL